MAEIRIDFVGEFIGNKVWVTVDWIAEVKARAQVLIWDAVAREIVSTVYHGEWKDPVPGLWYEHTFQLALLPETKPRTYSLWAVILDANNNFLAEDSRDITVPGAETRAPWAWLVGALVLLVALLRRKK